MTFPIVTEKNNIIWTVTLAALAVVGNMIGIELFLELKLYFGAMFVMLAVLRFGNPAGLVVATAAGVACWGECGHIVSAIVLVAEAWFVGRMLRRSSNIVFLDTLFWLICGMPVVFLSQRFFFGTETSLAVLLMLKQGVNGVLMALAAAFVIHFAAFISFLRRSLVRYAPTMHDVLVTTLVAAILFPGIGYVVLEIRRDSSHAQEEMRQGLESAADLTRELVQIWLNDKVQDVETLASLAGDPQVSPPSSIQTQAELMKRSSPHFLSMSVQNAAGISVAFVPQFNQEGVSNVGKDYSKQPYYHIERQTLRPAVSNVDMGTVNKSPRVALFAPIVRDGVFRGYCTGVIEVKRLAEQVKIVSEERRVEITLVDRKRQVVASTNPKLRIMQRVERFHGGDLEWLTGKVYRANLHGEEGHTITSRHAGIFGIESLLSTDVPWSIIVSAPVQPFMTELYHNASRGLAMLFVLILFSFGAAHAASAAFVRPVAHLERVSAALSADIIEHKVIEWPVAGTRDVEGLVTNIREMAETLHDYVNELQVLNESLEQRVLDRTEELRRSEERARAIFMEAGIGIVVADSRRRIIDANPTMERMLGYSRGELARKLVADISHPDDEALNLSVVQHTREVGLDVFRMEKRYLRKDGSVVWGNLTVSFLKERDGQSYHTVAMIEDISDRKRAEEEIRQLAYFDLLTGLANRTLFHDRLQQSLARAERQRGAVALLFLDLDRFKDVNDSLGHAYGDLLLSRVARRLERFCRKSDTFARLGGDEFVIIVNDCRDEQGAVHLAEYILEQMRAPFDLEGKEVFISTSIGIVFYPGDGDDAVSLQKHGDMALYAAKDGGGDQYVFFSPEMNRKALDRRVMEDNLRHALQNEELYLEYQPLFDLHSGRPFAVEALLRWEHPTDGLITPDRFIAVAEEIGLIRRIGEWVLRTACRQARVWHEAGLPVQMAVNVSGYQFNQAGFLEMVDQVLAESALPPGILELELTESTLMEGKRETIATLSALKRRGLRLAIDDFGTGYSSLSYLKHFPIDRVKIDRSFIRDIVSVLDDRAIVQAIIAMSHTLGLRVLAEGVELEGELELLKEWGCDEAQGFYFSRPRVASEMERFLSEKVATDPSAAAGAPLPGAPPLP